MKIINLLITCLIILLSASALVAQNEELAKINKFIEKGKVEKAKEFCFESTKHLTEEKRTECFIITGKGYVSTSNGKSLPSFLKEILKNENINIATSFTNAMFERESYYGKKLFPILGDALIKKDMINEAAEFISKINKEEYTSTIAEKFASKDKPYYNPQKAIELYQKLNNTEPLSELLFETGDYKNAITYISPSECLKYGDKLILANKKLEAIPFFIKHLNANMTVNKFDFFTDKSIINTLKAENNYKTFYTQLKESYIENLGPKFPPFPRTPESITAYAMLNNGKTVNETKELLKELKIMDHVANLIIIESLINLNKMSEVTNRIAGFKGEKKLSYYVFSELMLDNSNSNHNTYKASLSKKIGKPTSSITSNYIGSAAVIYALINLTETEDNYMDYWKFHDLGDTYNSLNRLAKEKDGEKYKSRFEKIVNDYKENYNSHIQIGKIISQKITADVMPLIYKLLDGIKKTEDRQLAQLLAMRMYLSMSDYHIFKSLTYDTKVAQKAIVNRKKWDEAMNVLDLGLILSDRVAELIKLRSLKAEYHNNIIKYLDIITKSIEEAQAKGEISYSNLAELSKAKNSIYFNYIESGLEFCKAQVIEMHKESESLKSKGNNLTESEQKHLKYLDELIKYVGPLPEKYHIEYANANASYNRGLTEKAEPIITNTALKVKALIKDIARLSTLKKLYKNPNPVYGKMKDIDGNEYKTVKIGNQIWMAENLKTSRYSNGEKIPFVGKASDWAKLKQTAKARVQLKKSATKDIDVGALYTYAAATNGINNINEQIQGVCPDGWHLPTDEEWKELSILAYYTDSKNASLILLDKKSGGFDTYGFSANLGGYTSSRTGSIIKENEVGFYWTSTSFKKNDAYYRSVGLLGNTGRYTEQKASGFSVRCVKNTDK